MIKSFLHEIFDKNIFRGYLPGSKSKIVETKLSSFHIKASVLSRPNFKYLAKLGVNEIDIIPIQMINLICVENRGKINMRKLARDA